MKTVRLICWAIYHLCTTPFIEFVQLLKAIRELDRERDRRP